MTIVVKFKIRVHFLGYVVFFFFFFFKSHNTLKSKIASLLNSKTKFHVNNVANKFYVELCLQQLIKNLELSDDRVTAVYLISVFYSLLLCDSRILC